MRKRFFRNSPLYLLTLLNLAYALRHGFSWLNYASFALSAAVLIIDIVEAVHGRKETEIRISDPKSP